MRNPDAIVRTKTIFLYELDPSRKEVLLASLQKAGLRVLCLEFLVQLARRSQDMEPELILCSPGHRKEDVYDNLLQLRRSGVLEGVTVMLYDLDERDPWRERFLELGVHNIISVDTDVKELTRIVVEKEKLNQRVFKTELVQMEKKTPDGTTYWLIMPKAQTQVELRTFLDRVLLTQIPLHVELVLISLEFCEQVSDLNVKLVLDIAKAYQADAVHVMVIAPPQEATTLFFANEIVCFPSMVEFNSSFLGQAKTASRKPASVLDLLDSIPD